jgi:hypothetical protein
MAKQIFPRYIHKMYYYLLAMSDEDLDQFDINDEQCRAKLFDAMKEAFDRFGPESKRKTLEAIEFILSSGHIEDLWGWVLTAHAIPPDEIEDKPGYLRALYEKLTGHEPTPRHFGPDVEVVKSAGPHGVDVRQ